jgi:hypothetical protein
MCRSPITAVGLTAALSTTGALSPVWAQEGSVPVSPQSPAVSPAASPAVLSAAPPAVPAAALPAVPAAAPPAVPPAAPPAVPPAFPAAVPDLSSTTPLDRGTVLSGVMGVRAGWIASSSTAGSADKGLTAGFGIGRKLGRLMLHLSAEFASLSTSSASPTSRTMPTNTHENSVFVIVPGFQVALLRSADLRVELLGAFRLGLGTTIIKSDSAFTTTTGQTRINLVYEVGPGARYWLHRHIAVTLLSGFRGDYYFVSSADKSSSQIGINGLFASLSSQVVF